MQPAIRTRHVLIYILKSVRPFPAALCVMFLTAIVWSADLSLRPYLLKVMLNRLSENSTQSVFALLGIPAIIYLGLSFLMACVFRLYNYFVEIKMIPRLREHIANKAFGCLVDKSHQYYQNNFSGSLANKVNDLTSSIPEIVQITIDRFFSHGLALAIAIYTLWQVNARFAMTMLAWSCLFIVGALLLSGRLAKLADAWSESASTITGNMVDVLSNILSVRLFSSKAKEKQHLAATFEAAVQAEQKMEWSYFWMWFCYGFSFVFIQCINFYFLLQGRQAGWISIGDFALVLSINTAVIDFLWQVTKEFSRFSKLLGRITQALRAVLETPDTTNQPEAKILQVKHGEIIFDKVQFHYKGSDPLFHNKSVTIASGQKVGLVGYSGSGKTTFVHLILRLYDLKEGRILIDHQNIQACTQESLRSAIAMIPQDPSLFHRSLLENIRYGRMDASDAEVVEAAKQAHAHTFITQLPAGYASLVGERGVKLSGGQRQRIAIARAILKNAPILILDEATSQLDSVTESAIQDSLWTLMQGKTTLVVAHRLSTLLHMDRILVFDQGRIVEDGTHQALLNQGGLYKTLWEAQVGGFLPDRKIS